MIRTAVFPGQGAQVAGMGRSLFDTYPAARAVFDEVDEALGEALSKLVFDGPQDMLTLTENAQPALMATSLAAVRAVESESGRGLADIVAYVAGHSLGEYSALAAAGSITIADAARLLRLRGQAMQRAVPAGQGAMAAILGLDVAAVEEVVATCAAVGDVCDFANDNSDGQAVVSGTRMAVERAVALAKERGAKRSMMLQVSAPFHCSLMQPAADELAQALAAIEFKNPAVPLIANVTAEPVADPGSFADLLTRQVTARVRWRDSMETMTRLGAGMVVEFGAGKVLSGLARRGVTGASVANIQDASDVRTFVASLS